MDITSIFAFGTLWFWLLALAFSAAIIASTESEDRNYPATIWFFVFLLVLFFCGNSEFFKGIGLYAKDNALMVLLYLLGYMVAGTIWSIFKWFFYLKRKYVYLKERGYAVDLKEYQAAQNKGRIVTWMVYWPLSALWTLINDPVRKAFEYIFQSISGIYNKMTERILGDLAKKK